MQSDWARGKYKIKNFQSSSALVVITFNFENSIKDISHKSWPNLYRVYVSQKYPQACVHAVGRKNRTGSVLSVILKAEDENQICLFPQRIIFKETLNWGFIFDQTVIAKSLLICIIPNHTIIRAEIKASVWCNCRFLFLLIVLKISTKDALVLSGALQEIQEGAGHLFSAVLLLLLMTTCLNWEQKWNHMERCYQVQNTVLIKVVGCTKIIQINASWKHIWYIIISSLTLQTSS